MLKIGISACFFHADPQRAVFKGKTLLYLEQSMGYWIMSEGALAYLIPSPAEGARVGLHELVHELDGLVLQGGSDVSPKSYGETPMRPEWAGDFIRDNYEIALVREFMDHGKPVLGICRGTQLLNVAFGGTLYQDITTQLPGSLVHRNWEIYDQNFHEMVFEKDSQLERLYPGQSRGKINSVHHQGIKALAKDLVIEARCPDDGIIEAVRHAGRTYCYGVQWHPEFHDSADKSLFDGQPILREFMRAATLA
jgi:putative glutamine amidotransferase